MLKYCQIIDRQNTIVHENMIARVKNDITRRKGLVENLLKEDQELLTEAEKTMVNVKVKSQLRSIAEQVGLYKSYN